MMDGKKLASKWHEIALSGDPETIAEALHEDAIFESPVVFTPQKGRPITTAYLASAGQVFAQSGFQYVGEWYAENSCILEFKAQIDGIEINGIDMISCNKDGLIIHFKVMVRPLQAVNLLHKKMGEMLAKRAG